MKFSILILTQPSRVQFLWQLLSVLKPQCEENREVETVIRNYDEYLTLGDNRERMKYTARGEYIAFIDDDDLVPRDYVSKILPLLDGVDQIGFQMELLMDFIPCKPVSHSLKHGRWWEDAHGYYRDISHVNPIRIELALQVPMSGGLGEDCRWSEGMRKAGIVKTEHFIPETMYWYLSRSRKNDAVDWEHPKRIDLLAKILAGDRD